MISLEKLAEHVGKISHMAHGVYYNQVESTKDLQILVDLHETVQQESYKGTYTFACDEQVERLKTSLQQFSDSGGGNEVCRLDLMSKANETLTAFAVRGFQMFCAMRALVDPKLLTLPS